MNTLLIYFAFPIAVIIFSIVLQKLLKNAVLVSSVIFAIFIVVTFTAFDQNFLIATLAYTILSLLTSLIVRILCINNSFFTANTPTNIIQENSNNNNNTDETSIVSDNVDLETNIPKDDNVINNNCNHFYKRKCKMI